MVIAGIALIAGGIAIAIAGAMARTGRLSRQSLVGIRTKATMASDDAWYASQRAGADWVIVGGIVMAIGGLLTVFADSDDAAGVVSLVTVAVALLPIVIGGVRGQAAARGG